MNHVSDDSAETLALAPPFYAMSNPEVLDVLSDFNPDLHYTEDGVVVFPQRLLSSETFCLLLNECLRRSVDLYNSSVSDGIPNLS